MPIHSTLTGSDLHNPLGHSAVGEMTLEDNTADAYRVNNAGGYRMFSLDTTTGAQRAYFGQSSVSAVQGQVALLCHTSHSSAPTAPSTGALLYVVYNGISMTYDLYCKGSDDTAYLLNTAGASSGHTITEDDVAVTDRTNLNFDGTAFNVTDDAGNDASDITLNFGTSAGTVCQGNDSRFETTSTDNAVVRFDLTVGAMQNSGVIIDDSNNITGVVALTVSGNITTATAFAIGNGSHGTPGADSFAAGSDTVASGTDAVGIGHNTSASSAYATAVGPGSSVTQTEGTAIGSGTSVAAAQGVAIGANANVGGGDTESIAIGYGASTNLANECVIHAETIFFGEDSGGETTPANVVITVPDTTSGGAKGADLTIEAGGAGVTAGDDGGDLFLYGGAGSGASGQHGTVTIGENNTASILSDVKFNHNLLRMRGGTIANAEEDLILDAFSDSTTDATASDTTLFTLEDNTVYLVEMRIVARATSGTAARAVYVRKGCFYREAAGGATQEGATVLDTTIESDSAWNAAFAVSSNDLLCRVNGDATDPVEWNIQVMYTAISSA